MIICHAYPQLLNLYGDYANLAALRKRLAGAARTIDDIALTPGSFTDFSSAGIVYFGAGTETRMLAALEDLRRYRAELEDYCSAGGLLLATGNALALFCKTITDLAGTLHEGLGLLDADVVIGDGRSYTECILETDLVPAPVVGVVNTSLAVTSREEPLFNVAFDTAKLLGANEGMRKNRLFATQQSGPLLVRNPALLDWFARESLGRELADTAIDEDWYIYLQDAYHNVLATLKKAAKK